MGMYLDGSMPRAASATIGILPVRGVDEADLSVRQPRDEARNVPLLEEVYQMASVFPRNMHLGAHVKKNTWAIHRHHISLAFTSFEEQARRRSSGSRIAVASSLLAPRNLTKRANPQANASANASSVQSASSSSHKPRMTNVLLVRSSLLSNRATSRSPHNIGNV